MRRHFGRRRHALDHGRANDERQRSAPAARDDERPRRSRPTSRACTADRSSSPEAPPARPRTSVSASTSAGQQAAGEQRRDRHAGATEPIVISTRLGGIVSAMRPGRRQQRDELAGLVAALLHLGKQHRGHRRHVGGLGARDAGHEVHGAEQHVGEAAAHVAEQRWRGIPPSPWPCRSSRSGRPRKTNSGTDSSIRCDMPSSMRLTTTVSGARGDERHDRPRVASPKAKAMGTPIEHATPTTTTKKISRLALPSALNSGRANQNAERPGSDQQRRRRRSPSRTVSNSGSSEKTIISATPTGMAATLRRGRPLERRRAHDRLARRCARWR